jgi:predicted NBD/HSP70 family sugar kinase/biotin operon repressor
MGTAPGSLSALREQNRRRVIAVLEARGAASQADIARATKLSRTTVSSLVNQLVAEGVIVERPDGVRHAPSPSGGRPPTLLTLQPRSGGFAGIEFGRESVRVAIANRAGELLIEARSGRLEVAHEAAAALATAETMVRDLLAEADITEDELIGAGVAVSAPVRTDLPGYASRVIFPSWSELDVTTMLSLRFGVPVKLGNDANLGALAEATFGAGRSARNILYVMLSEGIGGAVIIDKTIYTGRTGTAGELGHLIVNPAGDVCRCGNRGCLATVAGGAALSGALRQTHGQEITLDQVIKLVHDGALGAVRLIADAGRAVGHTLAGLCSLLDPGLVIIGGELAPAGEVLLGGVREALDEWISPANGQKYPVVPGELGAQAEVLGAVALAMKQASAEPKDR